MKYNAFISYSHAADGKLAPALQSGLHRFAKPWYRLRALHLFRDQTNLSLNPNLWSNIELALGESDWFILLASPQAAASVWVDREVEYWLQHRPADRILVVLTEGSLAWDARVQAFDPDRSTAVPQRLLRAFAGEPLYLDLVWARSQTDLSLSHPRFRDAVAEIAAALSGRPKDELIGDDVRQHQRARRLAWSAMAALSVLAVASAGAAWLAVQQRNIAEVQRAQAVQQSRIASARQLAAQSRSVMGQFADQLPLAVLLAVESTRIHATGDGNQALRDTLSLLPRPVFSYRPGGGDAKRVRALAFSPDGSLLAAARDDGTLELLQTSTGKAAVVLPHEQRPGEVRDLPGGGVKWKAPGMDAEVTAVAFSADGRLVATACNDHTARIWETASGREFLRVLHDDGVSTVAFNPAGTYLATGSKDKTARMWQVASGSEVLRVKHAEEVRKVAFSSDGRLLGAISTSGDISLVDANEKAVIRQWAFGDAGLGLVFSVDGTRLATASGELAAVWDVKTGAMLFKATHMTFPEQASGLVWVDDIAFSADGRMLATAGRDRTARIWSLATGQELIRLAHAADVKAVAFDRDGKLLTTASADGTARLWEVTSGTERLRAAHPGGSEVVAFSPDGNLVASGAMSGGIALWSLDRGGEVGRMTHPDQVNALGISPDGKLIATASRGSVRLWSSSGEPKSVAVKLPIVRVDRLMFSEHATHLAATWSSKLFVLDLAKELAVTPLGDTRRAGDVAMSSRFLARWDSERRGLTVWETAGGREVGSADAEYLRNIAFDSTGSFVAAMEESPNHKRAIRVWALPQLRELGRVATGGSVTFALGPQARFLAVSVDEPGAQKYSTSKYVDVIDIAGERRVARISREEDVRLAFHPDDDRLFVVSETHVRVFDLPTGNLRAVLGHEEELQAIRFSPESKILATLSHGTANIWNYATGELLSRISAGYVRDVRFAREGRYIITGSNDRTAVAWLWKAEDLREEACTRLTRNLTTNEWSRYLGREPYRKTCPNLPGDAEVDPGQGRRRPT